MYCRSCGAQIPDDSFFCPKCGTKVINVQQTQPVQTYANTQNTNFVPTQPVYSNNNYYMNQQPEKKASHKWLIWAVVAICVVLIFAAIANSPSKSAAVKTTPTPTPEPTAAVAQAQPRNGRVLISPSYEQVCPFTVEAGSGNNYYIRLVYMKEPSSTYVSRTLKKGARSPYQSDIAFFVKAGETAEIEVPIGVYKLYYATGSTFYDTTYLFGDDTNYYTSTELLEFSSNSEYYTGNTLTLYAVTDGNYETDPINESAFPTD